MRNLLLFGAISAFVAVALGAFGAHGLRDHVPVERIATWNTAAQYQMYHALALLLLATLFDRLPPAAQGLARTTGNLWIAGSIVFAGSLYALTLTNIKILGAITPLGGVCFLAGWACLALAATRLPVP